MICLQRKLIARVRQSAIDEGKGPKHFRPAQFYPVVGYSVQLRTRVNEGGAEREKIQVIFLVNDLHFLAGVYPSTVDLYVDPGLPMESSFAIDPGLTNAAPVSPGPGPGPGPSGPGPGA